MPASRRYLRLRAPTGVAPPRVRLGHPVDGPVDRRGCGEAVGVARDAVPHGDVEVRTRPANPLEVHVQNHLLAARLDSGPARGGLGRRRCVGRPACTAARAPPRPAVPASDVHLPFNAVPALRVQPRPNDLQVGTPGLGPATGRATKSVSRVLAQGRAAQRASSCARSRAVAAEGTRWNGVLAQKTRAVIR